MSQQTFYSEEGSGNINHFGVIGGWDAIHDASVGTTADPLNESLTHWINDVMAAYTYTQGGTVYNIWREFLVFDTSLIPNGAAITSASLVVNFPDLFTAGAGPYGDVGLVQTTQASTDTLVIGDFDQCGTVDSPDEGSPRVAFSVVGEKTFTLNATGLAWLNKGGITQLGLRCDLDLDDTTPVDGVTETEVDINTRWITDSQPKLVVNYSIGKQPLPTFFRATT